MGRQEVREDEFETKKPTTELLSSLAFQWRRTLTKVLRMQPIHGLRKNLVGTKLCTKRQFGVRSARLACSGFGTDGMTYGIQEVEGMGSRLKPRHSSETFCGHLSPASE